MLISQDRLAQLKEQLDYLEQAYEFAKDRAAIRIGKLGTRDADAIEPAAISEADYEFHQAGLDVAMNRIRLEIDFLTDYFK